MRAAAIVTAAGSSLRFGGGKKEFALIDGESVLGRAVRPFLDNSSISSVVVTVPPGGEARAREALGAVADRVRFVEGGDTRRASVYNALLALEAEPPDIVLVHDGARPFLSAALVGRVLDAAAEHGAAVPLVPVVDTPKETDGRDRVVRHLSRSRVMAAQTPQGFRFEPLLEASRRALTDPDARGVEFTDDAELYARYAGEVRAVDGEADNRKITFREDLRAASGTGPDGTREVARIAVGQGWDVHRLVPGRPLVLGGVTVPHDRGEDGHSDGDVLLHAVIDALFGAAALGDIGAHFPPSDERWRGADSADLAARARAAVERAGLRVLNVDCTVILERPRLRPHIDAMRARMADLLGVSPSAVSVKAKSYEGLGPVGEGLAVEAQAVVLLLRLDAAPR